jgi:hypothetical protein
MENVVGCQCPDCKGPMDYVCTLDAGDEEGRGWTALYQCPKCKRVAAR